VRESVITDEGRLQEAVDYFLKQAAFSFDYESQGENRGVAHLNDLTWLAMSTKGATIVIPFGHPVGDLDGYTTVVKHYGGSGPRAGKEYRKKVPVFGPPPAQLSRDTVHEIVRPLFFNDRQVKSAHGAIFDIASCAKLYGEPITPPYNCSVIQHWILHEDMAWGHGLKDIVSSSSGYGFSYDDEHVGKCVESHPFSMVARYAYFDAKYAWLLRNRFAADIAEDEGLSRVYELEMQVLEALVHMRLAGAPVDVPRLKTLAVDLGQRRGKIRESLQLLGRREWNPNSNHDKQRILFGQEWVPDAFPETQGLEPWKPTDTGKKQIAAQEPCTNWSTDAEALEGYQGSDLVDTLREYQEVDKLLSTYVLAYLGNPEKGTKPQVHGGRIYPDFVQYGTNTRRFSCRKPNLQNIPRPDTDLGKQIRGVFLALPGWKLVVADYSQIELVVFAHFILLFGRRGYLVDAFLNGEDPHQITADKLGIVRQQGKRLNFSMSYGATKYKIASLLGITVEEAEAVLTDHQEMFPEIYDLKEDIIEACRQRTPPHVRTILGGMRRLPEINSSSPRVRRRTERQAVSAVIQGSAADLIKLAMVRAYQAIKGSAMEMILTVHDEIVMHVPEQDADRAVGILSEAMTGAGIQKLIRIPLKADVKVVDRWSEAK
jgi:DNA polymerase I-like protein with 3'-5' exonuclease and polymerase domains